MNASERLRSVPLFAGLDDTDLRNLSASLEPIRLADGERLFAEGDTGDRAYLILSGEVEILKRIDLREVTLAVRGADEVIGEMALLRETPRIAGARARGEAELLVIPKSELDALLASSNAALRSMFDAMLDRLQSTQSQLRQSERMAQLGTLTAGLAHELNNPAAAVGRAAERLGAALDRLRRAEREMAGGGDILAELERGRPGWDERATQVSRLDALARSDLEAEMEDALEELGIPDAWRLAPGLVSAGLGEGVRELAGKAGELAPASLELIDAEREATDLVREVQVGTSRITALVDALKSYAFLDRAPVQDVDLIEGIEDTVLILGATLRDIDVRREYAADLPRITAQGAELNQVWTNLLGNAADAIHESGRTDGRVVLRAHPEGDMVVVEVEDNGVGIPPDAIHRVFDSFYTTKPPGSGTGLGLHISYGIVVHEHRGEITVQSQPGSTRFTVRLPVHQPS